jgi:hypothetical protein
VSDGKGVFLGPDHARGHLVSRLPQRVRPHRSSKTVTVRIASRKLDAMLPGSASRYRRSREPVNSRRS